MFQAASEIERLRAELNNIEVKNTASSWEGHVDRQAGSFEPSELHIWR
jgi:hypothetical protein